MVARLKEKVALVVGAGSIGPGWGNRETTAVVFARRRSHCGVWSTASEPREPPRSDLCGELCDDAAAVEPDVLPAHESVAELPDVQEAEAESQQSSRRAVQCTIKVEGRADRTGESVLGASCPADRRHEKLAGR